MIGLIKEGNIIKINHKTEIEFNVKREFSGTGVHE